jgi:hypothetical protein
MNGKFYENNIVIQYDKDLIEVWDEAKRLRNGLCEVVKCFTTKKKDLSEPVPKRKKHF